MKTTRVLVCGASGFIGRNVTERLVKRRDLEVTGTYFQSKIDQELKQLKIRLVKVDLTDKVAVEKVIRGQDIVIQAAAVTSGAKDITTRPYIHVTDNAVMNSLIFRECFEQKVKHVIFFSCTVMYPSQKRKVREGDFKGEITDKYFGVGWTKVYLEKMCEFYSKISKTKYTAIRHSNIYGPFDKYDLDRSHVFGATVTKVMQASDKIVVWGDGSEGRDLLYVSDLVDFVERIIKSQKDSFELINVGFGKSIKISELVNKIIKISGKKIVVEYDRSRPTINFSLTSNISKAKKKYMWEPKVTLEEGIKKSLEWYNKNIISNE